MLEIIKILAVAFINVAIFTRIVNFGFERLGIPARPRAFAVFIFITFFEFVALVFLIRDFRTALQTLLFYYMPFIVMWLMKDLLEASRKERPDGASPGGDSGRGLNEDKPLEENND